MQGDLEDLKRRIDTGEYEVNPHAVARAIIGRRTPGQPVSDVLVPAEVEQSAIGSDEPETPPRRDVA